MVRNSKTAVFILFPLMAIIWGFTWTFYIVAMKSISPLLVGALRNILASVFLLVFVVLRRIQFPRRVPEWGILILLGFTWITIPYAMVMWAVQYTTSGMASVLNGTNPFFVALFSIYFLKSEKMTMSKVLGLVLGFTGIIVIFSDGFGSLHHSSNAAEAVLFSSAVFTGLSMVLAKRYTSEFHSVMIITIVMLFGGVALLPLSYFFDQPMKLILSGESIGVMLFLSLFSSAFGFVAYMWLLKRMDAVTLSMIGFIVPVIALFAGAVLLKESISPMDLLGTAFVLSGLFTVNKNLVRMSRPEVESSRAQ
jgi:putative membrane protein PagO